MSNLVIKSYNILHITTGNQFKLSIKLESNRRLTLEDSACFTPSMNCDLVNCADCIFNEEDLERNNYAWSHFDVRRLT